MHPSTYRVLLAFVAPALACLLTSCQVVRQSSLAAVSGPAVALSRPFFVSHGERAREVLANSKPFIGTCRLDHVIGGLFFFEPDPASPFSCTVNRRRENDVVAWTMRPTPFLTDGASIPRALWCLSGFGPWDFTKSAVVHDWIFEAHHRWCMAYYEGDDAQMLRYADPVLTARLPTNLRERMWPLSIEEAADIIAACMDWEGRLSSDFVHEAEQLKNNENISGDVRQRLAKLVRTNVAHSRWSAGTIGQYQWATRSGNARILWDADVGGRSAHVSSMQLIRQLNAGPAPTMLDRAVADGSISPSLAARLARATEPETAP